MKDENLFDELLMEMSRDIFQFSDVPGYTPKVIKLPYI